MCSCPACSRRSAGTNDVAALLGVDQEPARLRRRAARRGAVPDRGGRVVLAVRGGGVVPGRRFAGACREGAVGAGYLGRAAFFVGDFGAAGLFGGGGGG